MSKLTSMLIIVTVIGVSGGLAFLLIRNFSTKMVQQSSLKSVQTDEIDLGNIQRQCAKSPNVPDGGFTNLRHDPQSLSMVKIYNLLEKHHLPKISFVWFSSSDEDQFLTLPNLYYDLFVHRDSRVLVGNDPRLPKGIIGSDAGPAGFWNPAYGLLPYNSFAEAMREARRELVKLPSDVADALAHDNFNAAFTF